MKREGKSGHQMAKEGKKKQNRRGKRKREKRGKTRRRDERWTKRKVMKGKKESEGEIPGEKGKEKRRNQSKRRDRRRERVLRKGQIDRCVAGLMDRYDKARTAPDKEGIKFGQDRRTSGDV